MRSPANAAYRTMRGPVTPASRILSASASLRYSFFCGAALEADTAAPRLAARRRTIVGRCMVLMSHLTSWSWLLCDLIRPPGKQRVNQLILRLHQIVADLADERSFVHRERENQIVNVPDGFPHADLKLLES